MGTVWWWAVPPSQAADSVRPADAKLISTPDSGAAYSALMGGGTWNGLARLQGPFPSAAAARAASPSGGSGWDVIAAGLGAGASNDAGAIGSGTRAGQAAASAASSSLSGLAAVGDFLTRLTQKNTWLRTGEVILGLLLIAVGVAKMTDAVPVATRIAKAVS